MKKATNSLFIISFIFNLLLLIVTSLICQSDVFNSVYLNLLNPAAIPLLLLNFLAIIIFILFRSKLVFINILTIIINFQLIPTFLQWREDVDLSNENNLLCLQTYNVHQFKYGKFENTKDQILYLAKKNKVDILCIQEYTNREEYIKYDSTYPYVVYSNPSGKNGVAIFSRFPIINHKALAVRETAANAVYADIKINKDTIRVISVHHQTTGISSNRRIIESIKNSGIISPEKGASIGKLSKILIENNQIRSKEVDLICEKIKQTPYPLILCGDFNEVPQTRSYKKYSNILNDAFISAGRGFAYSLGYPLGLIRIDYIFHCDEITPREFFYEARPSSDHNPAYFRFNL